MAPNCKLSSFVCNDLCFIGLPLGVLIWLFKFMNKERYIFEKNGEQLYRLDTISGKMHKAEGRTFIEVKLHPPIE